MMKNTRKMKFRKKDFNLDGGFVASKFGKNSILKYNFRINDITSMVGMSYIFRGEQRTSLCGEIETSTEVKFPLKKSHNGHNR